MKNINKILIILLSVLFFTLADAQNYSANLDFYVGTWVYSDPSIGEEFTVKLRKTYLYDKHGIEYCLVGAYTYKKDGQIVSDCMVKFNDQVDALYMPIYATNSVLHQGVNPNRLYMYLEDFVMRKKTFSNEIEIISSTDPKKIHWILRNDEGEYETHELPPDEFSIPTDVVLTKVE
jgi:hypothetical protein